MRTKLDPDDEFFIPEIDFLTVELLPNPLARKPGEKTEICIDDAIGYALRLIPSNKILARFESTLEAWPEIIRTIEDGRSPRTLCLDAILADGRSGSISAGPRLEGFARLNNGEPHPYPSRAPRHSGRRVAEGAA
ncbi:MAG: hypothetical protein ACSLFN_02750 [Candidatus Limnocylindrales bacterium]